MNRGERNNGLSLTSLRIMNLYFAMSEVRRNKGVATVGWDALNYLSEVDKAFLGYPNHEPQFGPFTFQAYHEGSSFWVGISADGKRIRLSQENNRKLIYHEIRIGEGKWMMQDPKECRGQEAVEFDRIFEGLVSIVEAKLGPQIG